MPGAGTRSTNGSTTSWPLPRRQGLVCAPHGIDPDTFPVFSKPIYNMRGMGAGSGVLRTLKEYKHRQRPGHMWMQLLQGEHVSTDVAVVNGDVKWQRHSVGEPLEGGMFDYWTVLAAAKPTIESYLADWVRKHLPGYTGMLNFETIDAAHHRGPHALRRPVARPLRRRLGRCAGQAVRGE